MRTALLALIGAAFAAGTDAAYCDGSPSPNAKQNLYPIDLAAPKLNRTAANGTAYIAGQPGFEFWVAHIYGDGYSLGYAHGSLFKAELPALIDAVWAYMEKQVTSALQFLPAWLSEMIANFGLDVALDFLAIIEKPSTPTHFFDELRGIADASGVDYQRLLRIHLIGELTQGDCSMYGAWGDATADGKTMAFRALDWDTDIPTVQYPAVFVYHPTEGHAFANVGFVGWIGALSGQSSKQMSIHEIGVSYPDNTFGNESFAGIPFTFLLRDILQFDNTYEDSIERIKGANRTCDLILGVGDGKAGTARGFQYSASVANVFDDTNLEPYNATWHPRIPSVVYWGMDWLCPSFNKAMADQIHTNYGQLDAAVTIRDIAPLVQTGDTHAVVYDLTEQLMYVSFVAPINNSYPALPKMAYDRQFTQLNLTALFNWPAPSISDSLLAPLE